MKFQNKNKKIIIIFMLIILISFIYQQKYYYKHKKNTHKNQPIQNKSFDFKEGTKWIAQGFPSYEYFEIPNRGLTFAPTTRPELMITITKIDKTSDNVQVGTAKVESVNGTYVDNEIIYINKKTKDVRLIGTGLHLEGHSQIDRYQQGEIGVGELKLLESGDLEGILYTNFLFDNQPGVKLAYEIFKLQ